MEAGVKDAEMIVEAATENTELKLKIFQQMDEYAPANCILATNTSSISITKIAAVTNRPEKVIGMHFMNPVPVMKVNPYLIAGIGASKYTDIYGAFMPLGGGIKSSFVNDTQIFIQLQYHIGIGAIA